MAEEDCRCIYEDFNPECIKVGGMSQEHALGRALGKFQNSLTLNNHICKNCNRKIGDEIEEPEYHVGLLAHLRYMIGIYNDADKRSPFYNGARGVGPSGMMMTVPETGKQLLGEYESGTKNVTHRRQIVLTKPDGKSKYISVKNWVTQRDELLLQIQKISREGYTQLYVYPSEDEEDAVRELCKAIGGNVEFSLFFYKSTEGQTAIRYDKLRLYRVAAKSAFHYALTQLPSITGHEKYFDDIKNFIMNGVSSNILAKKDQKPLDLKIREGLTDTDWIHVLACSWNESDIRAHCRFFDRPDSHVIAFDFILAKHNRLVIPKPNVFAHRFRYLSIKPKKVNGIVEQIPNQWQSDFFTVASGRVART
jgi:hypothetical protein